MKEEYKKILKKIIKLFPDLSQSSIEDCETVNTSPIGFIESLTLRLIEQKIFNIEIWTDFLNSISELNDEEVNSGIRYSLEVLYLENVYDEYLKQNLNEQLKKEYLEWVEYYKE